MLNFDSPYLLPINIFTLNVNSLFDILCNIFLDNLDDHNFIDFLLNMYRFILFDTIIAGKYLLSLPTKI